jgi:hypothetical protein
MITYGCVGATFKKIPISINILLLLLFYSTNLYVKKRI